MPVSPESETLQQASTQEKPVKATDKLWLAALKAGADLATALQAAAEATAHQPGGHLYNQPED